MSSEATFSECRNGKVLAALFADFTVDEKLVAVHSLLCAFMDEVCDIRHVSESHRRQLGKLTGETFDAMDAITAIEERLGKVAKAKAKAQGASAFPFGVILDKGN